MCASSHAQMETMARSDQTIAGPVRSDPDAGLVVLARNGDRDAFARLLARHYDFIHAAAYRFCGNRADAEDVTQTVCMRLGEGMRNWRGDGRFRSWLYRLVMNAATDMHRKRRRDERKAEAWYVHAVAIDGAREADDEAEDAELWAAIRSLPDKQRDAVTLVYGEGLSHGEAAEVMECAEGTVSYHIHAAKERLKKLLRDAGGDR